MRYDGSMALKLITFYQAAQIAGVPVATVRDWVTLGIGRADGTQTKLLARRITGREYTSEKVLAAFLRDCDVELKSKS